MPDHNQPPPKFAIQKYVAIPPKPHNGNAGNLTRRPEMYPWAHMQPEDSFFVPGGKSGATDKRPGVTKLINYAGAKKRHPGTKWTLRAVTENGVNGVRVWRTA